MKTIEAAVNSKKNIIVFGAGAWGRRLVSEHAMRIEYFVDNAPEKQGTWVGNIPVKHPDQLVEADKDQTVVIIANQRHGVEIARQLESMGFERGRNYMAYLPEDPPQPACAPQLRFLRYNVTYRCNSRCSTCSVWKEQGGYELSPEAFGALLEAPEFSGLEILYITGGEPTLRQDFADYIRQAVLHLPRLSTVITVTNGLLADRALTIMKQCHEITSSRGIRFDVFVSVDGLGEIHDRARGVPGSYDKAMRVVKALSASGVPVSASTTLSTINVWHADELRLFFLRQGLAANFKVGQDDSFFNKNGLADGIFSYSSDQFYQLKLFFVKIFSHTQEGSFAWFTAYNTLMMLQEKPRRLTCGYRKHQVAALMQNGTVKYCAGRGRESEPVCIDTLGDRLRQEWAKWDFYPHTICEECTGDIGADPSEEMLEEIRDAQYWKVFLSREGFDRHSARFAAYDRGLGKKEGHTVLITGPWGFEDIWQGAQLAAYIRGRSLSSPGARFVVCSTLPFVTQRTVAGLAHVEVVPVYDSAYLARIPVSDELVVFPDEALHPWSRWAIKLAQDAGLPFTRADDLSAVMEAYLLQECPAHAREAIHAVSCWVDADTGTSRALLERARALSVKTSLPCRFYAMNNCCLGPNGDNRDFYFDHVPQVFGEGHPAGVWIDSGLADLRKTVEAMRASDFVLTAGASASRLARAAGITPYEEEEA
ncbi:hypothetical protein SDC9_60629 [bioreactor metagenome]|uniref:Radical SAM core domain-containing protein n=1 Tax=bioreactor metagenome TaxID=1076179 RepID=A0A644XED7_9ZZZZ